MSVRQRLGLDLETASTLAANLGAMQQIPSRCFRTFTTRTAVRAEASEQHALRRAPSCYYSGNFVTGSRHGYVRRIALQVRGPLR